MKNMEYPKPEWSLEMLERRIFRGIAHEKARAMRYRLFVRSGLGVSLATSAYAFFGYGNGILQSDFWTLGSLVFSDASFVLAYWRDFGVSLAEAFPLTGVVSIMLSSFAVLLFANMAADMEDLPRVAQSC